MKSILKEEMEAKEEEEVDLKKDKGEESDEMTDAGDGDTA